MGMFTRQAVGLEVGRSGLRFAVAQGRRDKPVLSAWQSGELPADVLRVSFREPNLLDPSAFVRLVRDAWLRLLTRENRVTVSLPDAIGRTMLVDLDTRLKSKAEGADIIRWKLKKSLPVDVSQAHLDYQVLEEREDGTLSVLVSIVARQVIRQYEEALEAAGLIPTSLEFSAFSLHRLFSGRLEVAENSGLVMLHGGTLSLLLFQGGILDFVRSKELAGSGFDENRIFRELNSSFLVHREKSSGQGLEELFFLAPEEDAAAFRSVLAEASGIEPKGLDVSRFATAAPGVSCGQSGFFSLATALGAAARGL
jgi:type IV pilus assembly protein PilM